MARWSAPEIAARIEHTRLKPDTTQSDIDRLVEEARRYGFRGVCVPPYFVGYVRQLLGNDERIRLVSVVGFPTGYHTTEVKVAEAEALIRNGADELDMVMNNAAYHSGHFESVAEDVGAVVNVCHRHHVSCKVIIEAGLLKNGDDIQFVAQMVVKAGADYVKTSTGIFGRGATVEDIHCLRETLPDNIKIKASGGIRTPEQAIALLKAGADVLGTSSGIEILKGVI